MLQTLTFVVSFAVISLMFALLFKWMPDADVAWRDVILGAMGTAALFEIFAIGFYIGKQGLESTYGASASIVVVLIWSTTARRSCCLARSSPAGARTSGANPLNREINTGLHVRPAKYQLSARPQDTLLEERQSLHRERPARTSKGQRCCSVTAHRTRATRLPPEQSEQDDDRKRYAQQPEKYSATHVSLLI